MISTFGGFSTAKLGIRSSQQGLQITGNNITNINTTGYTRQRINQVSLYGGATDRYASQTDIRMGMGSLVTSISQIRDPFLDIRYRNEACNVGFLDEKTSHLEEVKHILDEVMKDGIHTGLEDIRTQLQNLTKNPTGQENDELVRGACQKLVSLLNKYAADLQGQKQDALQGFHQNVDEVNKILTQIRDLNVEIRKSQLHGDPALEMLDNRNLLIDKLSEMTKIKVTYSEEKISAGISVDKLTIELDAPGQDPTNRPILIDGSFANKLEIKPLGPDGKPDASVEEYDIRLGGLTDTNGDNPIVAQMKKEMQNLNNQSKSLDSLNQQLKDLAIQRQNWTTEARANQWTETTFNDPTERDKTIKALNDAITQAQKDLKNDPTDATKKKALQDARDKLSTFNKLDKQNTELKKQKDNLIKQRDNTADALEAALQKQGLTIQPPLTPNPDGLVSITVHEKNPGTPPMTPTLLVDGANPGKPAAQFGTKVDPNTGDLTLQLNNKDFKKIASFGEIEKQLNSLNNQLQALHDVNKKLFDLTNQRTEWDAAIKKENWTDANFTTNYKTKLADLKKELEDAREAYNKANAPDKEAKLQELKKAQEKLKTFNELKKQHDDMTEKQAALDAKFPAAFDALQDALKTQGLQATMTPKPPNGQPFSITITGGTPPNNVNVNVIDAANPTAKCPLFGTTIDANTGNLSLKLDNTEFKNIPAGQFDKTAHELDSLKDGKLYGVLEADLQFLNGKGEFGTPSTKIRGIAYYQRSLDTLAQTFAETMNKLNEHPEHPDQNRNLFASGDPNNKNITASNIAISQDWQDNKIHITPSTDPAAGAGDNSNIHNMISALNNANQAFKVVDKDGNVITDNNGKDREIFTGSFESMFTHINATLGSDMSTTATLLNTASIAANERAVARDNVSSVDLNEEGINLVQYQKSFSAACRVMTTLDEMLDSLLNVKR